MVASQGVIVKKVLRYRSIGISELNIVTCLFWEGTYGSADDVLIRGGGDVRYLGHD